MIHYRTIDSPIGPLTLAGRGAVLANLRMADQTHEPNRSGWSPNQCAFPAAVEQLDAYFAGDLRDFDVDLDLPGTEFQQRVWKALLTIPYGETRSYGEIAEQIGARARRVPSAWPTGGIPSPSLSRAIGSLGPVESSPGTVAGLTESKYCSNWRSSAWALRR
ncbi:6-O-methylguanine DNA methyltransferase, DNA binding domain protein [Mycobacterium kansasii 732]|nr:6-O-methylguanine DNA methyltransferase, DNA binding domain protein [Mycobacterium kansasii 732]